MTEFEFSVSSEHGMVSVEADEAGVFISQPCDHNDPDRGPGDIDIIQMTVAEMLEFHRKLGDELPVPANRCPDSKAAVPETDSLIAAAREWPRDKSSGTAHLINELADEIEKLRVLLDAVTRPAWRLANWNDHNYSYTDLCCWRDDVKAACRQSEPYLLPPDRTVR